MNERIKSLCKLLLAAGLVMVGLDYARAAEDAPRPPSAPLSAAALYQQHCVSCHGAESVGQALPGFVVPSLAGQEYQYLINQFGEWRQGWRVDSPDGSMARIAKALTDAEISELSQYFASLP